MLSMHSYMFVLKLDNRMIGLDCLPDIQLSVSDVQVDPAGFDISGHLVIKRKEDYDNITQERVWRLLSFASLGKAEFVDFVDMALDLD